MATCHSLHEIDGTLVGDPLDVKMFEFTAWVFEEHGRKPSATEIEELDNISSSVARPPAGLGYGISEPTAATPVSFMSSQHPLVLMCHKTLPVELRILRTFEFVSQLRRASVVVKHTNKEHGTVYMKGAPECMRDICNSKSCMPHNSGTVSCQGLV